MTDEKENEEQNQEPEAVPVDVEAMNNASGNPIYTMARAAKLLGSNQRSVADKCRSGELKAYRKFNKWYILHSDLIAFLKSPNK
jgi:hypothetical protein